MLYILVPHYGWPDAHDRALVADNLDVLRRSVELTCSKCTKLKDQEWLVAGRRVWRMQYRGPRNAKFDFTIVETELTTRVDHLCARLNGDDLPSTAVQRADDGCTITA